MSEPSGEELHADIPASHEKTQPPVTVKRYTASELDDDTLENLDLYSLVRAGTNLTDEESIKELAKGLFQNDDPPTRVAYVAETDGKAVAYMLLNKLAMKDSDPLGHAFASWLHTHNPEFANTIWDSSKTVAVVHGVTTADEWRGKGIQNKLWKQMVEEVDPSIIIGESKNPAAVVSRANAIAPYEYRTFFGTIEVTPNSNDNIPTPPLVRNLVDTNVSLYTAEGGPIEAIGDGMLLAPSTNFAATTPDVTKFPPNIQRAFEPLNAVQKSAGENKTVVQQLISVKNSLLNNPAVKS